VRRLAIDTHARDIGGFTPLAKGTPAFFMAVGDAAFAKSWLRNPERFRAADDLPGSSSLVPGETTQDTKRELQ